MRPPEEIAAEIEATLKTWDGVELDDDLELAHWRRLLREAAEALRADENYAGYGEILEDLTTDRDALLTERDQARELAARYADEIFRIGVEHPALYDSDGNPAR